MAAVLTNAWAADVAAAIQQGPSAEYKATKLDKYWEWVEMTGGAFTASVAIGISDPPPTADGSWLIIDFADGACTSARIGGEGEADAATFRLSATSADLDDLLDGYDVGKALMYRKLRLLEAPPDKIHEFFRAIYFLKEHLGLLAATGRPAAA